MPRGPGHATAALRAAVWLALAATAAGAPALAGTTEPLYRGEAIVTGQANLSERARGIRAALAEVLVKASADTRLADDARLGPILARAEDYVAGFAYEDRKKGIQISDEQGTRDRSFVLRVDFDRARIVAALAALGARPWEGERPTVLALLTIEDTLGRYVLGTETARGYGQREAFLAAARRAGVPLVLPRMDQAERAAGAPPEALVAAYGADALLGGTMVVTAQGYWDTAWTLSYRNAITRWTVDGTTFDRSIAEGVGRAARVLAGLE